MKEPETARGSPRAYHAHLDGLRALACLWVVTSHYSHKPRAGLSGLLERGYLPVCFFIVLSGFMTHYASADKPLGALRHLLRFHAYRVGRILPLHWVCLLLQIPGSASTLSAANLGGALLLTTSWNCYAPFADGADALFGAHQCDYWPINGLHWTLSTLLFSWLLYPLLRPLASRFDNTTSSRLGLCALLLLGSMAPAAAVQLVAARRAAPFASSAQFHLLYQWPPARLPDFMFGVAVSQLASDPVVLRWPLWPQLIDGAACVLVGGLLAFPRVVGAEGCEHRCGPEIFLLSGCNGFFGILMLGGCTANAQGESVVMRVAASSWLARIGRLSLHVYLLQELVAKAFLFMQVATGGSCKSFSACTDLVGNQIYRTGPASSIDSSWWMLFLATLVTVAATWQQHGEVPWMRCMRQKLENYLQARLL
ncbi:hypothetical protein AB1Y20_018125 [Prymnesium parvum]|uniref:Acyltransferase 3 domain-containing protein n=1 Tax=Prymnesium parvum TaxID=97485 RepID=A0AB34JM85_PRYPA